jgi:hypothetical protein
MNKHPEEVKQERQEEYYFLKSMKAKEDVED